MNEIAMVSLPCQLQSFQNAGHKHKIKTANRSFENVAKLKYLGKTVINQTFIHEEIRSILNSDNACYHSIQNLLSSRLLCKNVKIETYIPVVLYGCEPWFSILKEEYGLPVFENRVLRRIFGPKRDEMVGGWRKLHNEKLHNLYSSPNIISMIKSRSMIWAGHVARTEEQRNSYRILGKPEGKGLPGRPRLRWKDSIKTDIKEVG
jgi:hypothetical protein